MGFTDVPVGAVDGLLCVFCHIDLWILLASVFAVFHTQQYFEIRGG